MQIPKNKNMLENLLFYNNNFKTKEIKIKMKINEKIKEEAEKINI